MLENIEILLLILYKSLGGFSDTGWEKIMIPSEKKLPQI